MVAKSKKGFRKKFKEKSAGSLVEHTACPKCGSQNNLAVYYHDEDDSHSAYCWGADCGANFVNWDKDSEAPLGMTKDNYDYEKIITEENYLMNLPSFEHVRDELISDDLKKRGLPAEVLEAYGVKVDYDGEGEIYRYFYPTYRDKKHVGYRPVTRFEKTDKIIEKKPNMLGKIKNFMGAIGDTKKGIELFGQWLFKPEEHDVLYITEGEIDAMTGWVISKRTTKNQRPYAFVSLPSGANIEGLKAQLEYISKFKTIRLCFDKDDAGKDVLEKALKILPLGKVEIVNLPDKKAKDLNDIWKKKMSSSERQIVAKKVYHALWNGEKYSPAGVRTFGQGKASYFKRDKKPLIPFPDSFGDLNKKTFGGYGLGEITNIAAPSSVGKSSFIKEMINTALEETSYKIGVLSFEETQDEFTEGMVSIEMNTQLNEIPDDLRDLEAESEAFDAIVKKGVAKGSEEDRIVFVDHQGACDGEELMDKILFLINGMDCQMIILDPVTLALSGGDVSEDDFASDLVKIVKRHKIAWVNVHHIRKNGGGNKANSEGADISEEDIKGSGAWFQTAMNNVLLMRDKTHDNPVVRNTTKVKLSKCRRHGKNTGIAGFTYYNGDTGRLEYGQDPVEILEAMEGFETEDNDDKPLMDSNGWD